MSRGKYLRFLDVQCTHTFKLYGELLTLIFAVLYRTHKTLAQCIHVKAEHFTLCVKDNDTTNTAYIKIVKVQAWHIFTRTRTITMLYLKCKIVLTCDSINQSIRIF